MIPKIAAALVFIGLNFYTFNYLATEDVEPQREMFSSYPDQLGDWTCNQRLSIDDEVIENLGVTDYLICDFTNPDESVPVNFYVGYHSIQRRSDSGDTSVIHPPEHCLPGSGWDIIESKVLPIDFGIPGEAKRVTIAKGQHRQLVYFWYQSRGHTIARDFERLYQMFFDRALRSRTDGALVRITIPLDRSQGDEVAERIFEEFARAAVPGLDPYVPR